MNNSEPRPQEVDPQKETSWMQIVKLLKALNIPTEKIKELREKHMRGEPIDAHIKK